MPEATNTPTTPAVIVRRRRSAPAQVGAVTRTPKLTPATQNIIAEVHAESKQQSTKVSRLLQECLALAQARHRETAAELVPIGIQMDMPMLMDFLEIGRRMLAARGRA